MANSTIEHFIDGGFSNSQDYLDVYEPASGEIYAQAAIADKATVARAAEAAARSQPAWASLPLERRAGYLYQLSQAIDEHAEELAQAESRDTGKPLSLARSVDIPRAVSNLQFFAGACEHFASESHAMPDAVNYTLRQPLGVAACISPWNLPLYLLTWKIAPALAAGNTVVAKPSEVTPMTAYLLARLCRKINFPKGVLNIIHGPGTPTGAALVEQPGIQALSFTGSTATGRWIAERSAAEFKKVSLEMGGKNPTLVFADCDFEQTVDQVARAAFTNQGQICLCGSRILVESGIYSRFSEALLQRVKQLRLGDPLEERTEQGAVVSQAHFNKVMDCINTARREGGEILCGGEAATVSGRCAKGWFIQPTLIQGLDNRCQTNQEEIFGPVATLQPFTDEQQALALANDSRYGLACSIWTRDLQRGHRLARQINCGIVWINCWLQRDLRTPFGGMGYSGLGREGGFEAMRFFTEAKNICLKI